MQSFLYVCSILQRFTLEGLTGKRYRSDGETDFLGRTPVDSPVLLSFKRHCS